MDYQRGYESSQEQIGHLLVERDWLREQNEKLTRLHAERTVERDAAREQVAVARAAVERQHADALAAKDAEIAALRQELASKI